MKPLAPALILLLSFPMQSIAAVKKSDDYCRPGSGVDMVDTSQIVTDDFLAEMRKVGVHTVARYYDYENETLRGKRLRPEEVARIRAHGMNLMVVFQHNNNRPETFQDWRNRGPADAQQALKLARELGQPQDSAIYFGVDGDFVGPEGPTRFYTDEVIGYFSEINRVFDEANVSHPVGVYGSGETCFTLMAEDLAGFCWLSHSHGFLGTREALDWQSWDIQQYLHGTCGGRPVDFNEVREGLAAFGQWRLN